MELELGGNKYRTGKLNAFEQFNVMRRIAPILSGLGESFSRIPQPNGHDVDPREENANVWGALGPVAEALSEMTDENVNYVLKLCLAKCHRLDAHTGTWSRVTTSGGDIIYNDIDAAVMMPMVFQMIQENLENFFNAPLLQGSGAGTVVP